MSSTEGKIVSIKYPIFGIDWKRDAQGQPFIAVAGGGGAVKSGIKNCVTLARASPPTAAGGHEPPSLDPFLVIDTKDALVSGVAIGSKGGLLAVTIGNKTAIYRATSGDSPTSSFVVEFQTDFAEKDSYQNVVKFSPDGEALITGGEDGIIRLWILTIPPSKSEVDIDDKYRDAFQVSEPILLEGHNGCINDLSWHPSSAKVVSCAKDGQCLVWASINGTWKKAASMPLAGELNVQKPDKAKNRGKFVYRGCQFVPLPSSSAGKKNSDEKDVIVTVQTPARGSSYLSKWTCVLDNRGRCTVDEIYSIPVKDTIVCSLAVSAMHVASGSSDGQVVVHSIDSLSHVSTTAAHFLPSTGIAFFPFDTDEAPGPLDFTNALTLVSASADYSVYLISGIKPSPYYWFFLLALVACYLVVFFGFDS
ncbi:hypothetical protein H310_13209 [Aphanomyces invadans]|uniref:Uncharacterized protein n=1 Tax=Aphanomyces invadans TaxID=157072 RepID=A0A024TGS0_9STRA|nr:hypothetical protein H310_13209 [Aphanomyces invadans]ETV92532.1 hypothetical protein H310_13209 [Aphanomyces invadans]|eukprot:XP_008878839.1 hypothetical protein H310_13209 [Aphanomyces invadans]